MIGIYKITNNINQKVYIGQSVNIEERIKQHFWKASNKNDISYNSALHLAIRKYGKENFSWSIVEECPIDMLDEKEKYYIKYYNSLSPNGYNILTGGQKYRTNPKTCKNCGKVLSSKTKTGLCRECLYIDQQIVERPSKEELDFLLRQYNFSKVGKMYGVSDNAIRKWCKKYNMSDKAKDYK